MDVAFPGHDDFGVSFSPDGFELLDAAKLDAHCAVNMPATLLLAVEFARRAKALGRLSGHPINISSGQNWGPMPGELAYFATKGAIDAFTLTLASELAHLGITVNAIDPGATDTGWMTEQMRRDWSVPSGVESSISWTMPLASLSSSPARSLDS